VSVLDICTFVGHGGEGKQSARVPWNIACGLGSTRAQLATRASFFWALLPRRRDLLALCESLPEIVIFAEVEGKQSAQAPKSVACGQARFKSVF